MAIKWSCVIRSRYNDQTQVQMNYAFLILLVTLPPEPRHLLEWPAGQGCAEGWRKVVSPFEGKTELFQNKMTKKGPKTGSDCITPVGTISKFFRHFQESRKITKKLQYHQAMNDTHGPRFGTLFCHFFLKKFRFSLEGWDHFSLAFGATLPGGSI